ncbi:NACHT domain-containing protein [Lentzea atacamensis]|uniref:NACHT domain-containing protein n=1 Tax=Lentzea atacamensis TaxID=531938 RepID=A0A316HKM2_9PSEU|nr:NACHT domain-containing protein [Lentzea atacamensis]PWK81796.1 NACHT domain-containing protein [Lentzea atacamensis]
MASIESAVIRVVVDVSDQLSKRLVSTRYRGRAPFPTQETEELLQDLGTEADKLSAYLDSPDFAAVVTQVRVQRAAGAEVEEQLHQGLRLAGLSGDLLTRTTGAVHRLLLAACDEVVSWYSTHGVVVDENDLFAAATATGRLLGRLRSVAEFHGFAARMRSQVTALHNKIRLPHLGVSRAARYDELYVPPTLAATKTPNPGAPGDRTVVIGDPGAGKSTMAAKLAHDIASDDSGRVPFLVVLREFTESFHEGGHDLLHYLDKVCLAPYNVKPPRDGVEYLLRTGRAVVVLDGLDELVQTALRRRVVALVEGFAHLHPLVPILVTARKIGYDEAPLSQDLFAQADIRQFDEHQVAEYVQRWFVLDEATSPADRERLSLSFMQDSEPIPELRSNPLLLSLLCAMYSSDRYLPRNMAQVYERCALMLFEQWDTKRGIELPLRFHGRLRGAVQYLAWQMFTAPESGRPLPRTRIVATLTRYLEAKLDDHDESVATAEQFLGFCTGRAWILTDVGTTRTEPLFGFTHRTFLEYFAAEHLVRTHRTAEELWTALLPHINQWEVVAQIALQLYDRNVEDGVDELLTEAVQRDGLNFAARALRHMHPSTRVVRLITKAALLTTLEYPITKRALYRPADLMFVDGALFSCMYFAAPANVPAVAQTTVELLSHKIENGDEAAAQLLEHHPGYPSGDHEWWREARPRLLTRYQDRMAELRRHAAWGAVGSRDDPAALRNIVQKFGVAALYVGYGYGLVRAVSLAEELLGQETTLVDTASRDAVASAITECATPWANVTDFAFLSVTKIQQNPKKTDALAVMLALPFAELLFHDNVSTQWTPVPAALMAGRRNWRGKSEALRWLERASFPPEVDTFLKNWLAGSVSVTRPAPATPRRSRAPR